jgi:hypothetical protein
VATGTALKVDGIDNRGTNEVPYGFVYFTDGLRVNFAKGRGVGSGSNWGAVSSRHRKLAQDALAAAGIVLG